MTIVRPPLLRPGDTVALVSLSAGLSGAYPHRHQAGRQQLASTFGLRCLDAPNVHRDSSWLHRNPRARADDLHWAFTNDEVRGVVTTIGGDDSVRTIPYIDQAIIAANPKIVLGFSDTTVQHMINRATGIVSFYGPSLLAGFAENGGIHPYTESCVRSALFSDEPIGDLAAAASGPRSGSTGRTPHWLPDGDGGGRIPAGPGCRAKSRSRGA